MYFSDAATGSDLQSGGAASSTVLNSPTNQYQIQQPTSQLLLGNEGFRPSYDQMLYGATTSLGAGGGAGGSGSAAPSYDPADLDYLNDQETKLRNQIGSVDRTLSSGLTQLGDSYNREVSGANTNQGRALQDFAIKNEDTARGKDRAIERTNSNSRTLANSVRQRIGLASGSGSSAYQFAAPGAVAREATKNRTGVVESFGQNVRDLATGENRVKEDFQSLLSDLLSQKNSRESDFRSGILDRRNQIDGSLAEVARQRALLLGGGYNQVKTAMAPYSSAIDSRQAEIDGLFDKYRTPFSVKAVDTKTPTLRDYTVDKASISSAQQNGGDPLSLYQRPLQQDEEQQLQIY